MSKAPWTFTHDSIKDSFHGKYERFTTQKGDWRFYEVFVCKEKDGSITGSDRNFYCDGNGAPLSKKQAKFYYSKWIKGEVIEDEVY